ncbi:MAG: YdeI/OmpD-associated family protein [Anaerolineae bacterium]|nr:MAG: YdeI/OmpD-associated family protein [Anaerolineae bacterium]
MVDQEHGFYGWQVGSSFMGILEHSEMSGSTKDPGRIMLNFETTQVQEEFERIVAAGVQAGDQVEVTTELDEEPRTVAVPDDLAAALAAQPGAAAAFERLSYTLRKEYVRQVESAKALETRARIAGIVARLTTP